MASAFDIHFELRPAADSNGQRLFTFAYASARGVRGFQKTINQWVKCLFTPKGSDIADREYGTFFSDLIGGNFSSTEDVAERVLIAVEDATTQVLTFQRAQTLDELPREERLAAASVFSVTQTGATEFTVYVLLTNALNQGVKFALPTS